MFHVFEAHLHIEQELAESGHHLDEDTYAGDSCGFAADSGLYVMEIHDTIIIGYLPFAHDLGLCRLAREIPSQEEQADLVLVIN